MVFVFSFYDSFCIHIVSKDVCELKSFFRIFFSVISQNVKISLLISITEA